MTLEQSEQEYGKISGFVDHLREMLQVNDLRQSDISEALRDINFIRGEADLAPISEYELIDSLA